MEISLFGFILQYGLPILSVVNVVMAYRYTNKKSDKTIEIEETKSVHHVSTSSSYSDIDIQQVLNRPTRLYLDGKTERKYCELQNGSVVWTVENVKEQEITCENKLDKIEFSEMDRKWREVVTKDLENGCPMCGKGIAGTISLSYFPFCSQDCSRAHKKRKYRSYLGLENKTETEIRAPIYNCQWCKKKTKEKPILGDIPFCSSDCASSYRNERYNNKEFEIENPRAIVVNQNKKHYTSRKDFAKMWADTPTEKIDKKEVVSSDIAYGIDKFGCLASSDDEVVSYLMVNQDKNNIKTIDIKERIKDLETEQTRPISFVALAECNHLTETDSYKEKRKRLDEIKCEMRKLRAKIN